MHPRSHRTILSALLSLFLLVSQNVSVFAEEGNETVTEEETILEVTEENNETVTDETAEEEPEEMTETVPEETEEPEVQETSVPETEQSETAVPEEEQETATEEDLQEVAESEEPVPEETAIPEETAVPENTEQSEETVTVSETPEPEAEEELPEEENDQDEEKETEIYEADDVFVISGQELADSESLLESYLYQPVNDKNAVNNGRRKAARKQNLSGFSAAVYDYLSGKAAAIASGSLSSAHFTDTEELLANIQTSYTAEELGVSAIVEGSTISNDAKEALKAIITKEINAAFNALLLDAPYELYWYDKTVGMEDGYSLTSDGTTLTFTDLYISMYVSASYSADGTTGTTNVDASKTSAASAAIVTAQNTVSAASGQSDYEKLAYYKNWICEQVEYNHDAAGNSGIPYGAPWQIIYVFDGNEYTNVVCEGYSKAFKYLCDLTEFNNSAVEAYTVTGTMTGGTGAGPHMWDLVHMDNGKNYVVDVTNCDGNSIGAPDLLFMKAPVSFETDGYTFDCNGTNISYVYDGDTISAYSESERQISSWDYGTEPADISDYEYTASETVTITKYNGTDPEVVIPSEIEGKPVTGIGSFAFANNKTLTKVTIPDTVLVIDAWAFNLCSSLSEVVMSNNVTEIRTDAFNGCSSLSGIFIPASVTYIGELAFNYCGLTSITVDHANTVYDSRDNCNAIIETATNTLLFGSSNSFIPEGIETIRANAFGGRNLENVVIPESVTTIENYAFAGITAYSIEIPASVTSIGQNPFAGCINLAALTVSPSNSVYDSRDNCNAIIETAENKLIAGTYNTVIPESVTMISVGAFEECQNITSITVPGNVNEIGGSAFTRSSLSEVIINDGTAVIGSRAFGQCSSLTSVTLPASITNIGRNAFYQCTALATVNYTGTEEQWNAITVESGNECLTNAEIHFGGDIENPLPAPENFIDDGMGNISWDPVEGAAYYDITMESLEGRRRFALAENNIANSFNIYDYQSQFGTDYKYAVMVRIEACSAQGEEFNSSLSRFIYSFDPESPGIKAEWQYPDYVYWNFDSSYVTFDIEVGSYYIFELLRNDQVIFTEEKTAETEQIIVYYSELEETGKYSFRIRFGNDKQDAEISERIINGYTMDNTPVIPENLILTEDGKASFDVVTSGYYMVQLYFGDDNQVYGDSAQYLTSHYETDLSWYMNQNTGDYHLVVYTGHTSEEASNMDNAYTSNTVHFVSSRLPAPENVTVNENGIITWDPVSGADYYNINLKRLNGNSAIWSDGTNDTSFNINNHGAFVYGGWDSVVVLPSVQACSSSYPDNNSIETVSDKAYSLNDYNKGPIEAENCPSYVFWDTNNRNVAQFIIEMGKWYVFEFLKDDVVVFTETKQVDSEYTNIYPPALSDPGRYSFTIRIGDTQQDAENSTQKINSYVQKYNLPAEPLDTPSDLKWEDGQVSWKTVSNTSHYRVAFINTDTDTEEYVYDAYSYGADRATHWLDDSIRREYSHGWKFTVQAISENPSDYSNSEAAYSSEKQFADRQFTVSNTWVDIYSINTWSNPVSFEYTVNGEPGDPSELEYAANYDSLTFNVNADNTLTFIATKDGMYEFTVMYDGEYIQTMWINVYSSAYRYANINTGNTPIRAGNEYTFDVLYEVNDCEGDYSEISFEASEGNGNNCVTITKCINSFQCIKH